MRVKKKNDENHRYPDVIYVSTFLTGEIDIASQYANELSDEGEVGIYQFVKSGQIKTTVEVK